MRLGLVLGGVFLVYFLFIWLLAGQIRKKLESGIFQQGEKQALLEVAAWFSTIPFNNAVFGGFLADSIGKNELRLLWNWAVAL